MKRIGVDVDGVLRDIISGVNEVFKTHYSKHYMGDLVYDYDFPNINLPLEEKFDIIFNKFPKDIFLKTKPYPGSIKQFKELKGWAERNDFKLVCATSQEKHLISLTYLWLGKYDFGFEELCVTKSKEEIGLDYLIDDAPHNYKSWIKNGNLEKNFFLMDRDWNKEVPATNRIKNISEIKNIIFRPLIISNK